MKTTAFSNSNPLGAGDFSAEGVSHLATPAAQLEQELVSRPERVVVVAGIGVSLATCGGHPCATWKGLLEHGLQYCEDTCGTTTATLTGFRTILSDPSASPHTWISVGQFITDELTRHRSGCFSGWLIDSIGSVKATDTKLVHALANLGAKLATTNYDDMVEVGTNRRPITWRDRALATAFLRETTQDILHLHGYFRQPDSVILGARSYGEICRDDFAQGALRGLMISGTLVFVGCGAGLGDPNFGVLLEWARTTLQACYHSHFILVQSSEIADWRERLKGMPIDPIPYGTEYCHLTPFIEGLAKRVQDRRDAREPLHFLSTMQTDFDTQWDELERSSDRVPILEFFQRSKMVAEMLWKAGGRRRVAMAFSSRLTHKGQSLLIANRVDFTLDAAEWLLDEDIPSLASHHLGEIGQLLGQPGIPLLLGTRFHQLRVRCMDALCAYTESLRAIEEALPHTIGDERDRLKADRSEIHLLQGNFTEAVANPE